MGAKLDTGVGAKRNRPDINSDPNVIPFIDVMLVILIIFMVAAPISTVDVKVELPGSKATTQKRPAKPTWVSVKDSDVGPAVYVMNDQVSWDDLGNKVYGAVSVNEINAHGDRKAILDTRVYVRGDSTTQYKNIMRVMNKLQDAGFTKIALVAEDKRR
jgi:biopolymer transport protein ExbD